MSEAQENPDEDQLTMREFWQGEALRDARHYAQVRRTARYHEREALADMRTAAVAALDNGATTRRVQEVTGVSLATINRWRQQTRQDRINETYGPDPLTTEQEGDQ